MNLPILGPKAFEIRCSPSFICQAKDYDEGYFTATAEPPGRTQTLLLLPWASFGIEREINRNHVAAVLLLSGLGAVPASRLRRRDGGERISLIPAA